ncbi:hypothetical protein LguiB_010507 [Lonicera macranthoides]
MISFSISEKSTAPFAVYVIYSILLQIIDRLIGAFIIIIITIIPNYNNYHQTNRQTISILF